MFSRIHLWSHLVLHFSLLGNIIYLWDCQLIQFPYLLLKYSSILIFLIHSWQLHACTKFFLLGIPVITNRNNLLFPLCGTCFISNHNWVFLYIYIHTSTHVCVCVCIYMRVYTHIYTHLGVLGFAIFQKKRTILHYTDFF